MFFFYRRSLFPDHTRSDVTVLSACPVQRSVISVFIFDLLDGFDVC